MKTCFGILGAGAAVLAFSGAAFAADMPAAPQGTVAEAAPSGWNGAYIGANVGYGFSGVYTEQPTSLDDTIDFSGLFVGGQIGYNFALSDNVVFGIQGDLDWSNESGSGTVVGLPGSDNFRIDWSGSATAHLGLVAGNFLPYILGGVAFAHGSEDFNLPGVPANGTTDATHVGWTVGLGAEAKVSDNLSAFLEGRYTDYGSATYSGTAAGPGGGPLSFGATATDWTVRGGLNWHIN